mgnify:CR=1 FL=1
MSVAPLIIAPDRGTTHSRALLLAREWVAKMHQMR